MASHRAQRFECPECNNIVRSIEAPGTELICPHCAADMIVPTPRGVSIPEETVRPPAEQSREVLKGPEGMDFGRALALLKGGFAMQRKGWNGRGMFIVLMPRLQLPPFNTQGTERKVNDRTAKWIGEDKPLDCQPYIAMFTAQRQWQPGWLASQADMLAEDWMVYEKDRT